ncbi:alpha/beta hydrolase-fold protein [Microbulbifer sp. MLAF003]|uniref:alpha/beta hydrolase n=1 Tax=Microbulbifer sp. MLAF003 TaxID=3032582 RepID=UPI0024AD99D9|nr:alpha/beta hydrolase-fold protein [Microbulbifer sp. MLAF003]WHI51940.1 alpha/beta hydrolase-fold protein [Microbulbifer sp. MLAF003]
MKKRLLVAFLLLLPIAALEAGEHKALELSTIQIIPIQDSSNNREYELFIKLPEKYEESDTNKHPVIYYTDALWAVEILSATTEYALEDAILVGISWQKDMPADENEWSSRYRDFKPALPSDNKDKKTYKGEAHQYLAFIRNDVIQYIESNYRANPDNRTYFGYSFGGLFGVYVLMSQPDTFQNYIIGSPSRLIDTYMDSRLESEPNKPLMELPKQTNVFIAYGALEKELGAAVEKFVGELKNQKLANLTLEPAVIESANHTTAFPKSSVRSIYWLADKLKH